MRAIIVGAIMALGVISSAWSQTDETGAPKKGWIHYRAPVFPVGLRGVTNGAGDVVMVVTIDEQGKISDSVALQATSQEFIDAVNHVSGDWQFETAPSPTTPRREVLEFNFRRSGVITAISHAEAAQESFTSTSSFKIRTVQWKDLDAEPKKLTSVNPNISKAMLEKYGNKPLLVNFIIDEQGLVRVPVVSTTDAELAQSVLTAVRQWRYSPPMSQQKPIAVEVTRALKL
jgi:outer membrane biosynthesis protein TonB